MRVTRRLSVTSSQPKPEYNHHSKGGEIMSLDRHPRHGRQGITGVSAVIGITALAALLVARNVPPEFPKVTPQQQSTTSRVSSIRAVSTHDQRPRFDCNGLGWSVPVSEFLPFPPVSGSAHLTSVSQLFPTLQIKGSHYKRPPPLS